MKIRSGFLLPILVLFLQGKVVAQDTIKVMWYNVLNYPDINSARISYLQTIVQHVKPDVFVVCELTSASGASNILNQALNVGTSSYAMVNYVNSPDDENMLYYNTEKLGFVRQEEITTSLRNINEYVMYYKDPSLTSTSDTAYLYMYACHLKAGNTSQDAAERAGETAVLRSYLNTRPYAENTIVGGDMNIYYSSETAYQNLVGPTQANLHDPIGPGNYHANPAFAIHHTQSTRIDQIDGGSTGGMDDRFDMMLFSDDVLFGQKGVQFIPGSYRAIGQDGNHYNMALNTPVNNSEPANIINALYYMSDHLPIYMELLVGETVGMNESLDKFDKITLHPNPANDILTVTTGGFGALEIALSDMTGRTLDTFKSTSETTVMDVSGLSPGYYTLTFTGTNVKVVKRLMIQ